MLELQPLCVLITLPQASAAISKTGSKRKLGALYERFVAFVSLADWFEMFSLFKDVPSQFTDAL
jgi:hypothetical protein